MQPYMLEEFPPEISRLQPLFFSSDFGDQGKYLLSLYRSFYLCLCIAHDIIPLRPDLPYPVHDELPALSPKKYNITFLKLSVRPFEIYHISCMDQKRCLLAPMSQIAGRLSIQEGAKYLEKRFGGEGVLLAGVPGTPKANIVILGGGSVGTNACKIAVGMGANVTIMDINLQRLAYLDDIFGARIQTLVSNDANIEKAVKEADLVIGCVLIPGKSAPKIFKKKYLKEMKPGAVFVDVAVDQGGCGETTKVTYHDDPIFIEDGVVHYCVGNMPGAVPRTSTIALTNATLSYGLQIAGKGLEQACKDNEVIYSAINTYDGKLTCKNVADSFECYEYTDIKSVC